MKKVLIIGSAPDALEAQNWDTNIFSEIVVINNAWKIREDWSFCIFPSDFPKEKRPEPKKMQRLITAKDYVRVQNEFGGFIYAGGTMAFTAGYWALGKLKPDILFFLGCDMIYEGNNTHFYGKGKPDPLRKDISLRSLIAKSARLEAICYKNDCDVFNLSKKNKSNLIFEKRKIEDVRSIEKVRSRNLKIKEVNNILQFEKKLNYYIEDGKYWKHEERFNETNIDKLDKLWMSIFEDLN